MFEELGYMAASPVVIAQVADACGIRTKSNLGFDDLYIMIDKFCEQDGFTPGELEDMLLVFDQFDKDQSENIGGIELAAALRWLGFSKSIGQVAEIMDELDMDGDGTLDKAEFRKLCAKFREDEILKLRSLFAMQDVDDSGTLSIPELRKCLIAIGRVPATGEAEQIRDEYTKDGGEIDMWVFAQIAHKYRIEDRETLRKNQGFTEREVLPFVTKFRAVDKDNSGTIGHHELGKLLQEVFPESSNSWESQARALQITQSVDTDGDGTLGFNEFLKLMRIQQDEMDQKHVEREKRAIRDTGFKHQEVKEFRQIFGMFRGGTTGDMSFQEFQDMMANLVPMGGKAAESLKKLLESLDEDGNQSLDFSEFLHVMQKVRDLDFGGINERAAEVADELDPSARLAREEAARKAAEEEAARIAREEAELKAAEEAAEKERIAQLERAQAEFRKSFAGGDEPPPLPPGGPPLPPGENSDAPVKSAAPSGSRKSRGSTAKLSREEAEKLQKQEEGINFSREALDEKRNQFEGRVTDMATRIQVNHREKEEAHQKAREAAAECEQIEAELLKLDAESRLRSREAANRRAKERFQCHLEATRSHWEAKDAAKARGRRSAQRCSSTPSLLSPISAKRNLYEVGTGMVALRPEPSLSVQCCGVLRGGHRFYATPYKIGSAIWLRLVTKNVSSPVFSPSGLRPQNGSKAPASNSLVSTAELMFRQSVPPPFCATTDLAINAPDELWAIFEEQALIPIVGHVEPQRWTPGFGGQSQAGLAASGSGFRLPAIDQAADSSQKEEEMTANPAVIKPPVLVTLGSEFRQDILETQRSRMSSPSSWERTSGSSCWMNFRQYGVFHAPANTNCGRWRQLPEPEARTSSP
eukprot:gnl/TRDRNA2_/TRDRNA2_129925_c1_seq1.p1 gnl/TRDRNA2_/TRDRNA2_129925_c1~~gnl/TRDRNA2_/TRDRNA2_129925_c1_seq1.p1  ORF type:complete len:920 (+),score=194.09 gnl/TRDRNA2_/TRDRNA2_129925_c1_seq1:154-2760(+)